MNFTTAANTCTADITLESIQEAMAKGVAMTEEYRRKRDEGLAKIKCIACGAPVKALDRGRGEEWAMCDHMIEAVKRQCNNVPSTSPWRQPLGLPGTILGVIIVPLSELEQ